MWLPKASLLPEAGSNHTLLEVLKYFDSCYGMSYFQPVQEADMLKSQKKASLFVLYFWLTLEVECQKSIVSHLLYGEVSCRSSRRCAHFARSFVLIRFPSQPGRVKDSIF